MKRKGFTLIELLAVIVILAVIALIAVPTILGVIENARKGAFKDSVYGIMDSAEFYIATNLGMESGTFICNGEKCFNKLDEKRKLNFKGEVPESGTVIIEKNKISVSFLSNGKYCANGTRETLEISEDCKNLDDTPPEINQDSLSYTSTTNSVTIYFNNFAVDEETGIKEYKITLNNETKTVSGSEASVTFNKLKQDTEYIAIVKAINDNDKESSEGTITTRTKLINEPTVDPTKREPEESETGYYSRQTIKVNFNQSEKGNLRYFIKTTRNGVSNIEITTTCNIDTEIRECTEIESTKVLEANTWYEVDKDVEVTYTDASGEIGSLLAAIYDETGYSVSSTGVIDKISCSAEEVSYTNDLNSSITNVKDALDYLYEIYG